jgi:putative flippase GtrA
VPRCPPGSIPYSPPANSRPVRAGRGRGSRQPGGHREDSAQPANLIALLITAVANTAANRRITFGIRGTPGVARAQFQGLVVFGLGLGLTSGSLAVLHAVSPHPRSHAELVVLVAANAMATLLRFVLLRGWVFASRSARRRPVAEPELVGGLPAA